MGMVAAVAATGASNWLFHGIHDPLHAVPRLTASWCARVGLRFILYTPWLVWEIVLANLHVAYLVLHPKLPIAPSLVAFETSLGSERAQVLLAQSITLTPGTVTVDATDGWFIVHCLSARSRQGIEEGSIQRKVAHVFEESAPGHVALSEITSPEQAAR